MPSLIAVLKAVSVLTGAVILGNWFLSEFKKARLRKLPWYAPYLTPPGILILLALILPAVFWVLR